MKTIDISCLDYNTADKVAKLLNEKLKSKEYKSHYIDPFGTLFSQALRIVRTHEAIEVPRQSAIFLDAAREWDTKKDIYRTDAKMFLEFVVNPICYILSTLFENRMAGTHVKRVANKKMIRFFHFIPDYVFYLHIDLDTMRKLHRSRKEMYKRKLEVNTGKRNMTARVNSYEDLVDTLVNDFNIKAYKLEIKNFDSVGYIVDSIIEVLEQDIKKEREEALKKLEEITEIK